MDINGFSTKAQARAYLAAKGYKMAGALSRPESNPKVAKNQKVGVMSAPLHLAPAKLSGFEVCPQRSEGCTRACLHTAGNPAHMAGKAASRNTKTQAYFKERAAFVALIAFDIIALHKKAKKAGMITGVRLNATSDIAWERVRVTIDGVDYVNLMDAFPAVSFYDYTKVTKRALSAAKGGYNWPVNYHLTFSKTESNDSDVAKVLQAGGNVAIVFDHKDGLPGRLALCSDGLLHETAGGGVHTFNVIDGDEHDYRPADSTRCPVIVGLKAKGDAKADQSGFVMRFNEQGRVAA